MAESKQELRQAVRSRLLAQSPEDRAKRSLEIQNKLWSLPAFQKAKTVFFFVSMPEEVETHAMIDRALREGKRVAVPLCDLKTKKIIFYEISDRLKDLKPGTCGILEPAGLSKEILAAEAGCVIVPGVVFDKKKNRIGHGAGFYDRFLGSMDPKILKVGLAYSFQVMIRELPQESHDVALDELITD